MNRTRIKIVGSSGMGLLSVGDILAKTLKNLGYFLNADREYPSLIKGGASSYQLDFSTKPIYSLSSEVDIIVGLDEPGIKEYLKTTKNGGIFILGHERHHLMHEMLTMVKKKKLKKLYLPARDIAYSFGGDDLMTNMVLLGLLWRVLGFELEPLEQEVTDRFKTKPKLLEIDLDCLRTGYEASEIKNVPQLDLPRNKKVPHKMLINGNDAIALGAIQAGVRTYYAYPMSPSSSILSYVAQTYHETGMVVKQAEDEITAAQLAMGSMYAGARALVATSGGGFDLMTETVSCAALTETPLVIVVVQRPGPATGLPTWTAQADLNLAIHAAHGEFPRVVMSCSDPNSAYEQIQHALNIAEKYQTQVILLSDKTTAETQTLADPFKHKQIPIERGLVTSNSELQKLQPVDRYKITKNGLSKRWLPGDSPAYYFANGDEHWEDGTLTEDEELTRIMMEKRMKKADLIEKAIPEPKIYGPKKSAKISFIGWGSTKAVILDAIEEANEMGISVNYLHFEYLWPLQQKTLNKFFAENKNVHAIETSFNGQLAQLIEDKTKNTFKNKFLKYNGRPFFIDEVMAYIKKRK